MPSEREGGIVRGIYPIGLCIVAAWLTSVAGATELYRPVTRIEPVRTLTDVTLTLPGNDDPLHLRIVYPDAHGTYPVIVFSHGASCTNGDYAPLADEWARHGYVVILPNHPDAGLPGRPSRTKMEMAFRSRLAQMSQIIGGLERIETEYPELSGRLDRDRIVAAGHSMGALTAAVIAGLQLVDSTGAPESFRDPRVRATLLLSGPGPLPIIAEEGWAGLSLPLLVSTGTRDQAAMAGPDATWEWRLSSFALTPARDKYALVIQGADHFLGGIICPGQATVRVNDSEALVILQSTSLAFLDDYLKHERDARTFLRNTSLEDITDGRAELRRRQPAIP
jgi:predicted dienelactone hydrolase